MALLLAKYAIVWGGYFYMLPPTNSLLIWDKVQATKRAEAEVAWTNLDIGIKMFRMSRIDAYWNRAIYRKEHPAEKPVQLMEWCLSFLPENCTVFDPFMGSGNTGVACIRTNRKFVGCDNNSDYFAIAERRIADEVNRMPLLAAAEAKG